MERNERSLLLYLETCAVDQHGRMDARRLNADDFAILDRWKSEGFIEYGRVCSADHRKNVAVGAGDGTLWARLSGPAWIIAHDERKARAERGWCDARVFRTTTEFAARMRAPGKKRRAKPATVPA